jgi:hypothetical protein
VKSMSDNELENMSPHAAAWAGQILDISWHTGYVAHVGSWSQNRSLDRKWTEQGYTPLTRHCSQSYLTRNWTEVLDEGGIFMWAQSNESEDARMCISDAGRFWTAELRWLEAQEDGSPKWKAYVLFHGLVAPPSINALEVSPNV